MLSLIWFVTEPATDSVQEKPEVVAEETKPEEEVEVVADVEKGEKNKSEEVAVVADLEERKRQKEEDVVKEKSQFVEPEVVVITR